MAIALDHVGLLTVNDDDAAANAHARAHTQGGGASAPPLQLSRILRRFVEPFALTACSVAFHYLLRLQRITSPSLSSLSSLSSSSSVSSSSTAACKDALSDLLVSGGETEHAVLVGRK
jgi:hypothetical protein